MGEVCGRCVEGAWEVHGRCTGGYSILYFMFQFIIYLCLVTVMTYSFHFHFTIFLVCIFLLGTQATQRN